MTRGNLYFRLICAVLFVIVSLTTSAQSFQEAINHLANRRFESSTIINDALTPALSVIRQQYRLERGGDYYGKSKRPYYGETYTLGIKISGGTILQSGVVAPWENDDDYLRVNKDSKYKAEWYKTFQRSLQDSIWQPVELELGTQYVSSINNDKTLYIHTDAMSDFGLPTDETPGKKQGYLVWAYSSSNVQDSAMHVSLRQSSYQVEASPDSTCIAVTPSDVDKVIGGLFVVPVIERAGFIKLLMAGVASKGSDGNWSLYLFTKGEKTLTQVETNAKGRTKQKEAKEPKESNEVNTTNDSEPTLIN